MDPALASVALPREDAVVGIRTVRLTGLAIGIGIAGGFVAKALLLLIGLITNLAFYGRFDTSFVSPSGNELGLVAMLVPILGALLVGLMARFGSSAIRGHGIPEVMEKVLHGESRIPIRLMFLKPLSAAIAIGTGGPFGAEGPIIATGGALGSTIGQVIRISAEERKTLLAAGAAAGMSATFGAPVSAVLLAVELLLFEYRARSIIPVALASAAAAAVRIGIEGPEPVFTLPPIGHPTGAALATYALLGAIMGVVAAAVTRSIYALEDAFERLPLHWMWWPALGAVVVGAVGLVEPRTLGVGYDLIDQILAGELTGVSLALFVVLKFVSWSAYLGSGTSGGTLAPLFLIGGGIGAGLGGFVAAWLPALDVNPSIAGLVGMAAIFAGASHALLASVVFAFETTRQPLGLLPLLAGCSAAYLVMLLLNRTSIMTERLARRGTYVRTEYALDYLSQISVQSVMTRSVVTLSASDTLGRVRAWLDAGADGATHQGFPVVDAAGKLLGVVTRRNLRAPGDDGASIASLLQRPPVVIFPDSTLREAADQMVRAQVGRLAVVARNDHRRLLGIVSRSDLLAAHATRLRQMEEDG
ncbi:MAG TPA: chloride channel protein [Longimicrobiales bacterium]|nr:chloride channel protein [Longimicrobiales bacterium]